MDPVANPFVLLVFNIVPIVLAAVAGAVIIGRRRWVEELRGFLVSPYLSIPAVVAILSPLLGILGALVSTVVAHFRDDIGRRNLAALFSLLLLVFTVLLYGILFPLVFGAPQQGPGGG